MVRYSVLDRRSEPIVGIGQTVNVSSSGMFIRLQHGLYVEDRVAISVDLVQTDFSFCRVNKKGPNPARSPLVLRFRLSSESLIAVDSA
jgi:hypothetical protein